MRQICRNTGIRFGEVLQLPNIAYLSRRSLRQCLEPSASRGADSRELR